MKSYLDQVKYLGLIFNEQGLSIDKERIKAIRNLKAPTNKKELIQVMGMINYIRDFLPNLSELSSPIKTLLKADTEWGKTQEMALEKIEKLIC